MKMVRNAALVFEKLEIKNKTVCFGKTKQKTKQKNKCDENDIKHSFCCRNICEKNLAKYGICGSSMRNENSMKCSRFGV